MILLLQLVMAHAHPDPPLASHLVFLQPDLSMGEAMPQIKLLYLVKGWGSEWKALEAYGI